MSKRIQPKLSQFKAEVIRQACWTAAGVEAINLLRSLWLAKRAADGSKVVTETCDHYLSGATTAAGLMIDYMVLIGMCEMNILGRFLDAAVQYDREYAPLLDAGLKLLGDLIAGRRAPSTRKNGPAASRRAA